MNGQIISEEQLISYQRYLTEQEKSIHTVKKYMRDVHAFAAFLSNASAPFSKTQVIAYKEYLKSRYATSSVNSMLTPVNDFLRFAGMAELRANNAAYSYPKRSVKSFRCTPKRDRSKPGISSGPEAASL